MSEPQECDNSSGIVIMKTLDFSNGFPGKVYHT